MRRAAWRPPKKEEAALSSAPDTENTTPITVAADLHCRACGYNLRGLRRDGACPECGHAIALSLVSTLLRHTDVDWVRAVMYGLRMLLGGAACACATFGILVLAESQPGLIRSPGSLGFGGYVLAIVLVAMGAERLARIEPTPQPGWRARLTRFCVLLAIITWILWASIDSSIVTASVGIDTVALALRYGPLVVFPVIATALFALLYRLEHLSGRTAKPFLRRYLAPLRWLLLACAGVRLGTMLTYHLMASWYPGSEWVRIFQLFAQIEPSAKVLGLIGLFAVGVIGVRVILALGVEVECAEPVPDAHPSANRSAGSSK